MELEVGRRQVWARTPKAAALGDVGREWALAALSESLLVLRLGAEDQGDRLFGGPDPADLHVVLEVASHAGQVQRDLDLACGQFVGGADPGQQQQLGRVV